MSPDQGGFWAVEALVAVFSLLFGVAATGWLVARYPDLFVRANFLGRRIPAAVGIAYVLAGEIVWAQGWLSWAPLWAHMARTLTIAVVGLGSLGAVDDLFGDRSTGGFAGHFGRLLRERKLTTGAIKAIGGGLTALIAGILLHPTNLWLGILAAAIIGLSANALNLLDLRPGRCLAAYFVAFLVLGVCLAATHGLAYGWPIYLVLPTAALLFFFDSRGRAMLGDVGANSLGATVGVAGALWLTEIGQLVMLGLLVGLHVWTEKHSISKLIEGSRWLSVIDRKIGVR